MKRVSLRKKLIFSFLLILLIPSIVIGYVSYESAKNQILHERQTSAAESVRILDANITSMLTPKIHDIEYFAKKFNAVSLRQEQRDELKALLKEYINTHPEVELLYIGTADGKMIDEPVINMIVIMILVSATGISKLWRIKDKHLYHRRMFQNLQTMLLSQL